MSTPLFNTKTGDVVINISCIGKNVWSFSSTLRFNYVIIECTRKIFERLQHQAKDIDRCKYFNKIFLSTRIHLLWVERSVLRSWETMSGWQNMKSFRIWQPTNSTHEQNNLSVISKNKHNYDFQVYGATEEIRSEAVTNYTDCSDSIWLNMKITFEK